MRWFKPALTIGFALAVGLVVAFHQEQPQPEVVWGKQWGTVEEEWVGGIALDEQGNVYISGITKGSLFGKNQGDEDIFIVKLDNNGQILWSKQLGTSKGENGIDLCVDMMGNVYLGTSTWDSWFNKNLGDRDLVLLKLSNDGKLIWGKQFGTDKDELVSEVTIDQQNYIYVIGKTRGSLFGQRQQRWYEGFLAKFDPDGDLIWAKQLKDDLPYVIAVDSQGGIYVGGRIYDDNGNFLAKYASNGTLVWRQTWPDISERESELFTSLAIDGSNNIYMSGIIMVFIDENLLASRPDAFLAKHNGANGKRLWSKRLKPKDEGKVEEEFPSAWFGDVTLDRQGNIYVVGDADGSLFGNHLGEGDIVLAKFDGQGNIIWSKQWGTDKPEGGSSVVVDRDGNIYVAGATDGNLFGKNVGEGDIFVVKLRQ